MYLYYKFKTQDLEVTKKDFFESLDSYFGKIGTSNSFFEYETGLRMTFSIMKDLGNTNPKLLYTSLKSLYQSFVTIECENRRNVTSFDYYCEEELFNEIRTYLVSLLSDRNSTDEVKEICIKLILLIGNIRGSGEDFLVAYNLINKNLRRMLILDVLKWTASLKVQELWWKTICADWYWNSWSDYDQRRIQ